MEDVLSVWRSPLDKVALAAAKALCAGQPRCSTYGEDFSAVTIYNYGHYITTASGNNPNTALTNMLNAMTAPTSLPYGTTGVGGTAFIPQGGFSVTSGYEGGSPPPFAVPDQCNIVASGGGGATDGMHAPSFYHFVISPPTGATAVTYFLYCSGSHTSGGQYFRDLAFDWGTTSFPDTCIYANTWNCRAINCTFTDCPAAFNAQGLSCGLEASTVQYSKNYAGPDGAGPGPASGAFAAVVLAGSQCYAVGPAEFIQQPQVPPGTGPTDTCCISFESSLEHGVVRDLHISDWSYGITYAIASTLISDCMVTNVEFSVYVTCVYMVPSSSNGTIYGQKYTDCVFWLAQNSENVAPLIYCFGASGTIDDIQFTGCTLFQSKSHGYEFHGVSNVKVIGGTSSGNGPSGGAGIAITGGGGPFLFKAVNLDASYPEATNVQSQQYAFFCSGSPTRPVLVDGCSMQNYTLGSPVSVTGTPTELIITNCPGYNDLNTAVSTVPPMHGIYAAEASILASGSINYYGPLVGDFYGWIFWSFNIHD